MFIRSDNEYGHLNLNGVQPWETGFWIYHHFGPQPLKDFYDWMASKDPDRHIKFRGLIRSSFFPFL